MRQSVTMRFDPDVLKAARVKAVGDNRTLTNYIETLVRRDLQIRGSDPTLEVIAPDDVRDFVPIALPDETETERRRRNAIVSAVLDVGGY